MLSVLKKYYADHLYRNSIAFVLNSFLSSFFGLLFWIIAARLMPTSEVGISAVVISAGTMITYFSRLGMDTGLMRFLPMSKDRNIVFNTVLMLTLFLSISISLAYLAGLDLFSPAQRFLRESWLPLVFLCYVAFVAIVGIQNAAIAALRRADLMLVQNSILGIRIPLLFFMAAMGFTGIMFSFNIAYMVAFIAGIAILYKHGIGFKPGIRLSSIKESFRFSFGSNIADIWAILPGTVLPIIIINNLGTSQAAYYFIASSIASVLFTIPNAVSASLLVEGSHDLPLRENTIKSIKLTLLIMLPLVLAIILFGKDILSVFGSEYPRYSQEILILMVLSSLFTIIPSIYIAIKKVQKEILMVNYVLFASSLLVITAGYLLVLDLGILGVGYAFLMTNILVCLMVVGLVIMRDRMIYPGHMKNYITKIFFDN
jgi:O-antigen/teichoic acid export membrane protein